MYKDPSERRSKTKQTGAHPTVKADIDRYLEDVDFNLTELIIYAVESYMEKEPQYEINPYFVAHVPPYERRDANLFYRLRPKEWEIMKEYAASHGKSVGYLVYQALLFWLYEEKRVKK